MDKEDVIHRHTQTHTDTHTLDYYSDIKKKENLLFAVTGLDLEGIMLSEISQKKTNIALHHLYGI